jgi:hypothetical protein
MERNPQLKLQAPPVQPLAIRAPELRQRKASRTVD